MKNASGIETTLAADSGLSTSSSAFYNRSFSRVDEIFNFVDVSKNSRVCLKGVIPFL